MTKATPESSDSLVFECDFDEPPEKVWRALTEPQLLEAWLTAEDPSQSGSAKGLPKGSRPQTTDYEILTAEPHRLLRYRWRDRQNAVDDPNGGEVHSIVTFELAPDPSGGTHLRLTHGDFRVITGVGSRSTACKSTACVSPITSARRRGTPIVSSAGPAFWRRAA